jgi:NAD-dependent deacetylase
MHLNDLGTLVILTGAGISAESGVPTFRGPEGLWRDHRPEDLATEAAFRQDPELVWQFYGWRRELVAGCQPNAAHRMLVDLEREADDFHLITQNVDGLHQAAGSRNPIELHGSLWRLRCTRCAQRWEDRQTPLATPLPCCPHCGSLARPDVVWFDEALDPIVVSAAVSAAQSAQTMLVIGTSALVLPAAELPLVAKRAGAQVIEINPSQTRLSPHCDDVLRGPATSMLAAWVDQVEA